MGRMNKPDLARIVSQGAVAERRSLSDEAADALRELILLEKLAPGTPVPERDLAEGLGISRTPLKDALRILETEGLIEYGPTRRPKVADPSLEEIAQNIEVLGALEALAGDLACQRATEADIAEISRLQADMQAASGDLPALDFFHLDMAFHSRIVQAAQNAALKQTHAQYNARLWRARFMSSRQVDRRDNTLAEHNAIVEALQARDGRCAAREMRKHLQSTIRNLKRIRPDKGSSNGKT